MLYSVKCFIFYFQLHQSEIILDYAFSIKTESFNNSQDCVSLLVTALEELQNGIKVTN